MRPRTGAGDPGRRPADERPDGVDPLDLLATAVDAVTAMALDGRDASRLRTVARELTRACGRLEGVRARAVATATADGVVRRDGASSGAAWLAAATGGTTGAASRTAALGEALTELPTLASAVEAGTVGPEHAGAIARAAGRGVLDPDELDAMVDEARTLPAGAFSRRLRGAEDRADQRRLRRDERWARERRSASWSTAEDGSLEGRFRLPAVDGAAFRAAIERLAGPDPADVPDDRRRTPTQRRADALSQLARLVLDHGLVGSGATGRPHVTVTVPVTMLLPAEDQRPPAAPGSPRRTRAARGPGSDGHGPTDPGAWRDAAAEEARAVGVLPDGTVISAQTARRLLCDATVRRLVVDPEGRPLDVGRATRTWSPSQRAAVEAVDGSCRGPACDRPIGWTEIHHVQWWRNGGGTAVDNGLALCGACHDLVHHDGWTIDLDATTRVATWTSPTNERVTTHPSGPAAGRRR